MDLNNSYRIEMEDVKLDLKGKKRIKEEVEKTDGKVVTKFEYDDGLKLKVTEENGRFLLESNKLLAVQPDGITVKVAE